MFENDVIDSGVMMAMFIFMAIYTVPVFISELRQNKFILFGYWFVVSIHQIVAFACVYNSDIVLPDARGFHLRGEVLAINDGWVFALGAEFYEEIIGTIYRWFGVSNLLGEQFSILAFALSCVVFLKLIREFGVVRYKLISLLVFGALPSMVILGSMTIRESYQVLFFMLAVYFGIKMHLTGELKTWLIALTISALVMGWFHGVLIIYAAFLVVLFLTWSLKPVTHWMNIKKLRLMACVIGPIIFAGMLFLSKMNLLGLDKLSLLFNSDWLEAITTFRSNSIKILGRASYGIVVDNSSYPAAVYSIIKIYIHYLFAPFPWQVGGLSDLYASMESIMRMILIYFSVKQWCYAKDSQRRLLGLMLILYFSMTFMWSLGTTNYGTSIRHHMLSWWVIVIVGIPPLMEKLSRFSFRPIVNSSSHRLEVTGENFDRN